MEQQKRIEKLEQAHRQQQLQMPQQKQPHGIIPAALVTGGLWLGAVQLSAAVKEGSSILSGRKVHPD